MMEKTDIPFLSVSQLSELIKSRQVSPVEVVEAYLERIDRLNDQLYAYLTVCRDQAVEAARELEQELARGEYRGPLHGVPVAVKDQLNTAGIRTTCGTPIFNDYVPDEDATVIAKLKSAGAILLGKLNMTEFGTTSLSHAFATARNPWDLERFTGGSSSGSGGATAACMCATSLGEDTGGSVRGPAAPKIEPDPIIDCKESSHRNRAGLTTSFSLASAPALSICCGFTSENLPIGLQIGGKPFAEQMVLNVAYAYQ